MAIWPDANKLYISGKYDTLFLKDIHEGRHKKKGRGLMINPKLLSTVAISGATELAKKAAPHIQPYVEPAIKPAVDLLHDKIKENRPTITIPELYSKKTRLPLKQAVELLETYGIKAIPRELNVEEANIEYRNCFADQVVNSSPKCGEKIPEGTGVVIEYLSQEVIDESRRIYEEAETRKKQIIEDKKEKRHGQRERVKQTANSAVDVVKKRVEAIPNKLSKNKKAKEKNNEQEEC